MDSNSRSETTPEAAGAKGGPQVLRSRTLKAEMAGQNVKQSLCGRFGSHEHILVVTTGWSID
jgi:hypothetical protein